MWVMAPPVHCASVMSARPSALVVRAAVAFVVLATAACAADEPESDGESAAQASTQNAPATVRPMTTCLGSLGSEVTFGGRLLAQGSRPACRYVATVSGKQYCVTSAEGCKLERSKLEVYETEFSRTSNPEYEDTCAIRIWTGRATDACECTLGAFDTGYNPKCTKVALGATD